MTAPLTISGLTTRYGRKTVLSGIDLSVAPGTIFGLIGLNGAGKTTLIKSVLDLIEIRQGTVELFGESHLKASSRRNLAYLPEQFLPSPYLTGNEFVELSLSAYGLKADRAEAEAMAERLALDPAMLGKRVTTYSKGMGQKAGLIGTLLTRRALLMLDEPMSGLDPRARIRLKDTLVDYRDDGHTVFLCSHILADLDELCDQIAVLHQGHLVYDGPPAGLRELQGEASLERAFLRAIDRDEAD